MFPSAPIPPDTSGVRVGASGYGFVPPNAPRSVGPGNYLPDRWNSHQCECIDEKPYHKILCIQNDGDTCSENTFIF